MREGIATVDRSLQNAEFIGLLDSARTAHPVSDEIVKENWWMPADKRIQAFHSTTAHAILLKHILWGQIIQLPRNQFMDSPAWFDILPSLIKSEIPLFSICILGEGHKPDDFVTDCFKQFRNIGGFAMSSWPGLANSERITIGNNIERTGNFKKMFKGINLDSNWKIIFKYQQECLQKLLEYLENNNQSTPLLIREVAGAKKSLWQRIEEDIKDQRFKLLLAKKYGKTESNDYISAFQQIYEKAIIDIKEENARTRWLNQRTHLYREIRDLDKRIRSLLRTHIDKRYEENLSESVTGIGKISTADRIDTSLNLETREKQIVALGSVNDPNGYSEGYLIDYKDFESQKNLFEKIPELINNEECKSRILHIRRIRAFQNNLPINYIVEEEQDHLEAITRWLTGSISRTSNRIAIYEFVYHSTLFMLKIYISLKLGEVMPVVDSAICGEAAGDALEIAFHPIDEKIKGRIISKEENTIIGEV